MGDVVGGADGAEIEVGGGFADGLVGLRVLGQGDEDAVGAEDAGLFAGDLGDGVAEVVLVVERDVGDDGEEGVDDVGGVETAAQADFEDGDVDRACASLEPFSGEVEEGERGEDLEEAGGMGQIAGFDEAAGGLVDLEVEAGEVVVGDLDAVDLDALVDADEVGRGVEAGAVAGGGEDAGQGGGRGAFAVGSGDQDRREGWSADRRERRRGRACGRGRTCGGGRWEGSGRARGPGRRDGRPLQRRTWGYFRRMCGVLGACSVTDGGAGTGQPYHPGSVCNTKVGYRGWFGRRIVRNQL